MNSSSLRSARSLRLALPALIALLSVATYLVTSAAIRGDRDEAAERRAQVASVRTQGLLGRARAYVIGLGNALAGERAPSQRRFTQLEGTTAKSIGLIDAQWVQRVPRSGRAAYERRLGAPIVRLTRSGRFERAPAASVYLPATFTTQTRPELRRGVDVSYWPALATAIRHRASIFAATASALGSLGSRPGFYLVQAGRFGRGRGGDGFLAVFVQRGWMTVSTEDDPRGVMISLGGRRLEGQVDSPVAHATFETLGRRWRIDAEREPPSGLQSALPWLALGWPFAAALLGLLLGRAIVLRRRAQRSVDRIFDFSPDLLASAGFDGYFKRVNPAFERTLGYSVEEFLSRPYLEFVHPDDRERTTEVAGAIGEGQTTLSFENRYLCKDGSYRWIQWTSRPVPEEGVMYGMGRDVTERRRAQEEQAALRRVATLVARGVPPSEVFAAVASEVGLLVGVDATYMARYEPDGTATGVAAWSPDGGQVPVGTRVDLEGENVAGLVLRTGRPARVHGYEHGSGPAAAVGRELGLRLSVGAPIVVDQRLWGVMIAASKGDGGLPADAESRIAAFTELVATAISNTEARAQVGRLADEQAALRRVATLVARGAPPEALFAAVVEEVGRVFPVENVGLARYESGGTMTTVAISERLADSFPVGGRWPLGGKNVSTVVFETGRSARIDSYGDASGRLGVAMRERGLASSVGAPIVVEGRVWGVMTLASTEQPLPADTEARLASFTELVATAISNIQARSELAASRARLLAAADDERRRVVRDLHDGAQQGLVHTVVTLKLARRALEQDQEAAPALVSDALHHAEHAIVDLRELAHDLVPGALTRGGLRAGVEALASRMPVPVEIDVFEDRLPPAVEATAYFVVAEALTNVAKHAHAAHADVTARIEDGTLAIQVVDDGVGGARRDGSGLTGLADRLATLDGELRVESPADGGTLVAAAIPLPG